MKLRWRNRRTANAARNRGCFRALYPYNPLVSRRGETGLKKEFTMKRTLWVTAATIALMAGMNAASAQVGGGEQQQPHMQNSPSGATVPKGEEKMKPGAAVQRDQKEKGKISQGQEVQPRREGQSGPMGQNGPQGGNPEKMGRDQGQGQGQVQGQVQGKGSARSVQLSSEQRAKIHASLANRKAGRVTNENFTVNVGARVPRTVRFYPLPIEIVDIVPEYQGYDYVLVGDEIVIIDPNTLEIVAVLPA
jgi:hypothetical protein